MAAPVGKGLVLMLGGAALPRFIVIIIIAGRERGDHAIGMWPRMGDRGGGGKDLMVFVGHRKSTMSSIVIQLCCRSGWIPAALREIFFLAIQLMDTLAT